MNVAFPRFLYLSIALHLISMGILFYGVFSRDVRPLPVAYVVRIIEGPASVPAPPETVGQEQILPHVPEAKEVPVSPSKQRQPRAEAPVAKEEFPVLGEATRPGPEAPVASPPPLLGRKKLFDRDILRMIAQAEKPAVGKEGITFDTEEYKYRGYMRRLKETIESIWDYPREAADKGIYGDLFIRFVIKKDGRLGEVKVVRTSGHRVLDSAALKALRDAEPFWPLPEEWGVDALTVTGHFVYTIYGMEIR